ncbi:MAG: polyprenyl synthetase family protein [Lutibacter sp.]|uniref:polyprenyl synthetase family protein n=1 Tax=Lutibacter sp. TaxID=1925666 RepID=UPI00299EB6DC|nr:polyprenyl synthetase family protein [Lutibacter sp.]MDX1829479.1 polyprenyl synthetase family protein [Lutibacter sp.]
MKSIENYKEDFLLYLNEAIKVKEPKKLYEPIHYILQLGGKRLRPVLTLLICDIYNGDVAKAMNAAAAIEVFHNFTLIHDDIMDNAIIRRGKTTVHEKWNINAGILSGDAMMIMAYQLLEKYEPQLYKKLNILFSKTALEVCEGQQLDIDFETKTNVSIPDYIKMITYKTSVLVAAAMKMGAILANVSNDEAEKIYKFGLNLGIAFQLQDDYLDTFGDVATFGKEIGGDINENKKTFLFLKALEVSNDKDKKELLKWYSSNNSSELKVNAVTKIFSKNKIQELTKREIENYTKTAIGTLDELSVNEDKKEILKNFGLILMNRAL